MHTQSQSKKRCTLMLLTNLAEPEWVPIKCDQRIIGDIMCMVPRNVNTNVNISLNGDLVIFEKQCIFISGKCYLFSWGSLNGRSVSRHEKLSKFTLVAMEYLVTTTNAEFPPFEYFLNLITYCKMSRK